MALGESIVNILDKNKSAKAPAVVCDETDLGAVVRLTYENDASYNARTSADVESVRKVGKFALGASEVTHPRDGSSVVVLQFSASAK